MWAKLQNILATFFPFVPYKLPPEIEQGLEQAIRTKYPYSRMNRFFARFAVNKMYPVIGDAIQKIVSKEQAL